MAGDHGLLPHLIPPTYRSTISAWLEEDCPTYDYGGFVVGEAPAQARLFAKSTGLVAGIPFFNEVFKQLDCTYVNSFCYCYALLPSESLTPFQYALLPW